MKVTVPVLLTVAVFSVTVTETVSSPVPELISIEIQASLDKAVQLTLAVTKTSELAASGLNVGKLLTVKDSDSSIVQSPLFIFAPKLSKKQAPIPYPTIASVVGV